MWVLALLAEVGAMPFWQVNPENGAEVLGMSSFPGLKVNPDIQVAAFTPTTMPADAFTALVMGHLPNKNKFVPASVKKGPPPTKVPSAGGFDAAGVSAGSVNDEAIVGPLHAYGELEAGEVGFIKTTYEQDMSRLYATTATLTQKHASRAKRSPDNRATTAVGYMETRIKEGRLDLTTELHLSLYDTIHFYSGHKRIEDTFAAAQVEQLITLAQQWEEAHDSAMGNLPSAISKDAASLELATTAEVSQIVGAFAEINTTDTTVRPASFERLEKLARPSSPELVSRSDTASKETGDSVSRRTFRTD